MCTTGKPSASPEEANATERPYRDPLATQDDPFLTQDNGFDDAAADLPFGGVGASGMGKYHGIEGCRTLSHPKGILVQGRWNAARLLYAPFGKRTDALLNFFLR
jgi:hypothetical protein